MIATVDCRTGRTEIMLYSVGFPISFTGIFGVVAPLKIPSTLGSLKISGITNKRCLHLKTRIPNPYINKSLRISFLSIYYLV